MGTLLDPVVASKLEMVHITSTDDDAVNWLATFAAYGGNGAENTVLIKDNISDEINAIKRQPGKDIWFLGSVALAQTFMQLDLIDEYRININPTVLGKGVPYFADTGPSFPLKLLEARTLGSGVVALRYEREREE